MLFVLGTETCQQIYNPVRLYLTFNNSTLYGAALDNHYFMKTVLHLT